MLLQDKIAVVTGASRGIGRATAKALAREGAMVIVNYNGSKERADEVVSEIEKDGGKAKAIQCNVSDFDQAKEFFGGVVKEYGRIDILVNNAGITRDNLIMKMSEEEFQDVIQTNLAGVFNGIKFVTRPMMKQRQGRIINMASVSGIIGNMGQANLFRFQSRCNWSYQSDGKRIVIPWYHSKCSSTWIYCNRDDGQAFGCGKRRSM